MPVVPIADPADIRLQHYTRLTDMQLRMVAEPAEGVFVAEGAKVIRRALAAGLEMVSALMEAKWWPALESDVPPQVSVFLAPPAVLESVTGFRVHRGALATFRRPPTRDPAQLLAGARTAILLEDLVDHTNVGAVFRCAAGLGIDALLVTARCADPWYRRSIKTSMAAVFSVPWTTVPDAPAAVALARQAGMTTIALDPAAGTSLRDWRRPGPVLLLLGTEGAGLSDAARGCVDRTLSIPMHHGVDSLNVAAAAAIGCYVLSG